MFEEWKRAWDQAVQNFERELQANDNDFASPSQRAHAMRRDLNAARTALNRLQSDLAQARKDLAAEEESEQTARRRAEMAQRIDDGATVRIAAEFAERHAQRAAILRRKVEVLQDELGMRQEELGDMEKLAAAELQESSRAEPPIYWSAKSRMPTFDRWSARARRRTPSRAWRN